jgi:serine/threonine protein kinase
MGDWELISKSIHFPTKHAVCELEYDFFYLPYVQEEDKGETTDVITDNIYDDNRVILRYHHSYIPSETLINEYNKLAVLCNIHIEKYCQLLNIDNKIVYEIAYYPRTTLDEHIKNKQSTQGIVTEMIDALAYLHSKNVPHLNLDLTTITIQKGHVCLSHIHNIWHTKVKIRECLKQNKDRLIYTSPEILTSLYLELSSIEMLKASDIWSLGLIIYQLSTGRRIQTNPLTEPVPVIECEELFYVEPMISWNWWQRSTIQSFQSPAQITISEKKDYRIIWSIVNKILSLIYQI